MKTLLKTKLTHIHTIGAIGAVCLCLAAPAMAAELNQTTAVDSTSALPAKSVSSAQQAKSISSAQPAQLSQSAERVKVTNQTTTMSTADWSTVSFKNPDLKMAVPLPTNGYALQSQLSRTDGVLKATKTMTIDAVVQQEPLHIVVTMTGDNTLASQFSTASLRENAPQGNSKAYLPELLPTLFPADEKTQTKTPLKYSYELSGDKWVAGRSGFLPAEGSSGSPIAFADTRTALDGQLLTIAVTSPKGKSTTIATEVAYTIAKSASPLTASSGQTPDTINTASVTTTVSDAEPAAAPAK